jgi:hypothetical protein
VARAVGHRLVAVGVRDPSADRAALDWAVTDALSLDTLHVVHGFVPLRLDRCTWEPVRRARDARELAAQRVVSQSVQRARELRGDLRIGGSSVAGLPDDVLVEFSQVVDLLVIGDDSTAPSGNHRVAWRVQSLAACPVVSVPSAGARFDLPLSVVVDEHGLIEPVLRFAIESAQRHSVGVRVSRSWSGLHAGALSTPHWLAQQSEELDLQVADWQVRYPHVGMTTSIETGDDWWDAVSARSSLIVTAGLGPEIPLPWRGPVRCPFAVVPASTATLDPEPRDPLPDGSFDPVPAGSPASV